MWKKKKKNSTYSPSEIDLIKNHPRYIISN